MGRLQVQGPQGELAPSVSRTGDKANKQETDPVLGAVGRAAGGDWDTCSHRDHVAFCSS